ncbi:hypothetical protein [Dokdonella soli]|uniref:DUF7933 domain-containing protein n=1 Tax=Dokdonella soli TaxID=529810 RepID=UPI0031DD650E
MSAVIALAVCGVAHADVVTFSPFDISQISPASIGRLSPNGAYLVGTNSTGATGFRYNMATRQVDLLTMGVLGVNSAGTLAGALLVNGGTSQGGTDTGAYAPIGSNPVAISNPLLEDSGAYGISDDGTLVGLSTTHTGIQGVGSAYVWSAAAGMKKLPVNRTIAYSRANGISTDGHIIYGWNDETYGFRTGVIWVDGAPQDIGLSPSLPYGEADGISANDQFVVGSYSSDINGNSGGWRWNRADNSVLFIPDMDHSFAVSNDGKTIVGNAGFFNANYTDPLTALIWHEGVGTMRLVDWITANGGTVPADWNVNLDGAVRALSSDATFVAGWSASSTAASYTVQVTPDKLFSDAFDGTSLGVFATLSPSTILAQGAQGAPATLTIDLDNPGKADATLTSDFIDQLPFGLVIAATPNASNTCSADPLVAYAGYDTITLHGGAVIPAGRHCVISIAVTSNLSGTYQNVIPTGSLVTSAGQNRTDSNTSLQVIPGGNGVVHSPTLNHVMVDATAGSTINWVTGAIDDAGPKSGPWDLNLFDASGGHLTFTTVKTNMDGLAVDTGNNVIVMHPGDVVGPSTYLTYGSTAFLTSPAWLAGVDGYVGFRFQCDKPRQVNQVAGGFCYGYARVQTTAGTTGYPVTLVSYAFDGDGRAITVGQ